jgi:hypothetical protein
MALYYLWNLAFLKVPAKGGKQGGRTSSKTRRD